MLQCSIHTPPHRERMLPSFHHLLKRCKPKTASAKSIPSWMPCTQWHFYTGVEYNINRDECVLHHKQQSNPGDRRVSWHHDGHFACFDEGMKIATQASQNITLMAIYRAVQYLLKEVMLCGYVPVSDGSFKKKNLHLHSCRTQIHQRGSTQCPQ